MKIFIKLMTTMKYISFLSVVFILFGGLVSCEKIEEEPAINLGYESNVRVPDAEELATEDIDSIQSLKDEYAQNAK